MMPLNSLLLIMSRWHLQPTCSAIHLQVKYRAARSACFCQPGPLFEITHGACSFVGERVWQGYGPYRPEMPIGMIRDMTQGRLRPLWRGRVQVPNARKIEAGNGRIYACSQVCCHVLVVFCAVLNH